MSKERLVQSTPYKKGTQVFSKLNRLMTCMHIIATTAAQEEQRYKILFSDIFCLSYKALLINDVINVVGAGPNQNR